MSYCHVCHWIYHPTSWLKLQKKLSWIECDTFYWSKRSRSEKTLENSPCFIVLFCGSCRQRKPIQLLNGSNCSNFETTLLRKIPPLTLEGLNWIPSKTHLCLKIQIHFVIWSKTLAQKTNPITTRRVTLNLYFLKPAQIILSTDHQKGERCLKFNPPMIIVFIGEIRYVIWFWNENICFNLFVEIFSASSKFAKAFSLFLRLLPDVNWRKFCCGTSLWEKYFTGKWVLEEEPTSDYFVHSCQPLFPLLVRNLIIITIFACTSVNCVAVKSPLNALIAIILHMTKAAWRNVYFFCISKDCWRFQAKL